MTNEGCRNKFESGPSCPGDAQLLEHVGGRAKNWGLPPMKNCDFEDLPRQERVCCRGAFSLLGTSALRDGNGFHEAAHVPKELLLGGNYLGGKPHFALLPRLTMQNRSIEIEELNNTTYLWMQTPLLQNVQPKWLILV